MFCSMEKYYSANSFGYTASACLFSLSLSLSLLDLTHVLPAVCSVQEGTEEEEEEEKEGEEKGKKKSCKAASKQA